MKSGTSRWTLARVHRDGAIEIASKLPVESGHRRRSGRLRLRRGQQERRRVAGSERGHQRARQRTHAGGRLARTVHVEEAPVLAVERRVLGARLLEGAARVRELALHLRERARKLLLEVAHVARTLLLAATLALRLCRELALIRQLLRPQLHLGGQRLCRLGRLPVRRAASRFHLVRQLLHLSTIHKLRVQKLFLKGNRETFTDQ